MRDKVQWDPKQALGDDKILAMDWDSKGMHYTLCWVSWQQEPPGTIPDDDAVIRRWLGSPSEDIWRRVRPQVMAAWPVQNGRRVNAGMVRAWERQQTYKQNGSKSRANPKQIHKQSTITDTEPDSLAEELPEIALAQKIAAAISWTENLQPIAGAITFCVEQENKTKNEAVTFLLIEARRVIAQGGWPDRFWWTGRKWRNQGNGKPKSKLQENLDVLNRL